MNLIFIHLKKLLNLLALVLFDSIGLNLGATIPFSINKFFNVINNKNEVDELFNDIVEVKVEYNDNGHDFISDLYFKILTIISYVNLWDKTFVLLISEYLPLNNILLFDLSSKK